MVRFYSQGKDFVLDGERFSLRSGAIHYFRTPRAYWVDRLLKLKECGLNTVETYIPWNLHEPYEGVFDFDGEKDVVEFFRIAQKLGLYVIVRPGPYICAEWEAGGLPFWLLNYPDLRVRCSNGLFMEKAFRYLKKCTEIFKPFLIENGGNILMLQVENEYGSYGSDKDYLRLLVDFYKKELPNCLLCTSDGASLKHLTHGAIDGVLTTVNFGSKTEANMAVLESFRENQPLVCMEFWCGWFDTWQEEHHTRPWEEKIAELDVFLKNGYGFNLYMFLGGTNFGFMNGANIVNNSVYTPQTTSYDYDAFLTESGDRTEAYFQLRRKIAEFYPVPELTAQDSEKRAYGGLKFTDCATLFENLDNIGKTVKSVTPCTMESLGQAYGYILYRTRGIIAESVRLMDLKDRAILYCDGEKLAELDRNHDAWFGLGDRRGSELAVLVENCGRVNYGAYAFDKKGVSNVLVGVQYKYDWENICLPMDNLQKLSYVSFGEADEIASGLPAFFKGEFFVDKLCDTFFEPKGFSKGVIFVNGVNIGRFNNFGCAQKTYYVPKTVLKLGKNEVVVFDENGKRSNEALFVDSPKW